MRHGPMGAGLWPALLRKDVPDERRPKTSHFKRVRPDQAPKQPENSMTPKQASLSDQEIASFANCLLMTDPLSPKDGAIVVDCQTLLGEATPDLQENDAVIRARVELAFAAHVRNGLRLRTKTPTIDLEDGWSLSEAVTGTLEDGGLSDEVTQTTTLEDGWPLDEVTPIDTSGGRRS